MMYWPRPSELVFRLSEPAAREGREIIYADLLTVDRCWRGSIQAEYIPHTKSYHIDEIDQRSRDELLKNADQLDIPCVRMLGSSHLTIQTGTHLFVLLREMADLGYIQSIPFALLPCDAEKFRYYFRQKSSNTFCEQPMLALYGDAA